MSVAVIGLSLTIFGSALVVWSGCRRVAQELELCRHMFAIRLREIAAEGSDK